jgi:hypothetical protein
MALQSRTICQWLMGVMGGALLFSLFFALDPIAAYRLSKLGAQVYVFTTLVSVPISIALVVREWRRPQRALHWPFTLLAVSALPPLLLAAMFWNDPD